VSQKSGAKRLRATTPFGKEEQKETKRGTGKREVLERLSIVKEKVKRSVRRNKAQIMSR